MFFEGSTAELTVPTPTIESGAGENASMKTQIGGRSIAKAVSREPERAWITGGRRGGAADYRSGEREHMRVLPMFF